MSRTEAPELKLPVFEGPLELLLHLIEKNKISIYDIPIFEITRQYLDYLKNWDDLNMEVASEFIVMAATLIGIKARRLVPAAQEETDGDDDEALLIQRLLEYKKYKDAAGQLRPLLIKEEQQLVWRQPEVIQGERLLPTPEELLKGHSPEELLALCRQAERSKQESYDVNRAGFRSVRKEQFTVSEKIRNLRRSLELTEQVSFMELRRGSRSKEETITYFMAMLELSRMELACLNQQQLFGDIIMKKREEEADGQDRNGAE